MPNMHRYIVSNARDTADIIVWGDRILCAYRPGSPFEVSRQQMAGYISYWRRSGWTIRRVV